MTLQQLAEATGLSVGYLSLMERGLNSPTIANLHKVCRAIHTTMIELFSDIESGKLLVRNGERQVFFEEPGKLRYEKMIDGNRLLVSTSVSVMDDEEHAFDRHITDEFGIVFRGSLEVTVENTAYQMQEGDSIYIPAGSNHSFRRLNDGECIAVWISPSSQ